MEPEMEKAKEAVKDISTDIGDVLIYALYPTSGMQYLKWKFGLEEPPAEVKAKTLEDVKREDELIDFVQLHLFVIVLAFVGEVLGISLPPLDKLGLLFVGAE